MRAKVGQVVCIELSTGQIKHIKVKEVKTHGIEGYNVNLLNPPLQFFTYHNIISVTQLPNI